MLASGDFWNKSPSRFLKILKLPSFYSDNFKILKNTLGQLIPNCLPKHVITSTNLMSVAITNLPITSSKYYENNTKH